MLFAIASLSLALLVGAPADVTGKWEGTLTGQRPDGTTSEDSAYMVLEQKGTSVTGTVAVTSTISIRSRAARSKERS